MRRQHEEQLREERAELEFRNLLGPFVFLSGILVVAVCTKTFNTWGFIVSTLVFVPVWFWSASYLQGARCPNCHKRFMVRENSSFRGGVKFAYRRTCANCGFRR
jgi:hypothetical protein